MRSRNRQQPGRHDNLTRRALTRVGSGGVTTVTGTAPITSTGGANPAIGITPATDSAAGSMSAADKTKLDGITPGAGVASVSGTAPITSSGGTTPAIGITAASDSAAGSMSAADKTKLDGIAPGAAVSSVTGTAPITSSGGDTPAIGITAASDSAAGSMSAADKTKLDGIAPGAAVSSVTGTAPITSSGGDTPAIGITAASDSAAGSMSAADKTKLDALIGQSVPVVANVAALAALNATGMPQGQLAVVQSVGALWELDPTQASPGSNTVTSCAANIPATPGTGLWQRAQTLIANTATAQTTWHVNPSTGSDEANGLTTGTALATKAEIIRRWGTRSPTFDSITVTLTQDTSEAAGGHDPWDASPLFLNGAYLILTMPLPSSPTFTTTIATLTAKSASGGQALAATFTSGVLNDGMLLVNTSRGNSRAYAERNTSGSTWQLTQPEQPYAGTGVPTDVEVDTWAAGDTVVGYNQLLNMNIAHVGGTIGELVNISGGGGTIVWQIFLNDESSTGGRFDSLRADGTALVTFVESNIQRGMSWSVNSPLRSKLSNTLCNRGNLSVTGPLGLGPTISAGYYNATNQFFQNCLFQNDCNLATGTYRECTFQNGTTGTGVCIESNGTTATFEGNTTATGLVLYNSGGGGSTPIINVVDGVFRYTAGAAATTFVGLILEINGATSAYSFATSGGLTAIHLVALSAANLAAAAGAAGFGDLAAIPGVGGFQGGSATP